MDKYYDNIAQGYDELHTEEQLNKMIEIVAALGADVPKKNERLLDVGCGTGISTSVWSAKCFGIDPSKELIDIAKKKHPGKEFTVAAAEAIPFPDKSFDVVISVTSIHNFTDIRKAIMEMRRVGKDRFVITLLRKSKQIDEITKLIIINFRVKKIVQEDKDLIFICKAHPEKKAVPESKSASQTSKQVSNPSPS